jgi:hypothetical protein
MSMLIKESLFLAEKQSKEIITQEMQARRQDEDIASSQQLSITFTFFTISHHHLMT